MWTDAGAVLKGAIPSLRARILLMLAALVFLPLGAGAGVPWHVMAIGYGMGLVWLLAVLILLKPFVRSALRAATVGMLAAAGFVLTVLRLAFPADPFGETVLVTVIASALLGGIPGWLLWYVHRG